MKMQIRGLPWHLVIKRPPQNNCSALCVFDQRTIYVRPSTEDKLECVVHEILHACFPDLDERAVQEAEDAIVDGISLVVKHDWLTSERITREARR